MTPSIFDAVWKLIDPLIKGFGLTKTELVGILAIGVAVMAMLGRITSDQAMDWLTILAGVGALTLRDAVRKAEPKPPTAEEPRPPQQPVRRELR